MCNLAADFGLMPSLFEPCGIVQDEFFVAGTPVIAFSTGGLKVGVTRRGDAQETVRDWDSGSDAPNGFLFQQHSYRDFLSTIRRALGVFGNTSECLRCAPLTRRYDRLRATTSTTTIEVMNQARDYMSEFCRMRRCLLPSVKIPFTYVIPPNEDPQEVFLVGSFTEWEKHRVPMHRFKNMFVVFLHLPAGDYLYKWVSTSLFQCRFIVDGQWRVSAKMEVFKDDGYNYNHAITVPKSTNTAVSRVIERLLRVC